MDWEIGEYKVDCTAITVEDERSQLTLYNMKGGAKKWRLLLTELFFGKIDLAEFKRRAKELGCKQMEFRYNRGGKQ